jgi:hypothetical protein
LGKDISIQKRDAKNHEFARTGVRGFPIEARAPARSGPLGRASERLTARSMRVTMEERAAGGMREARDVRAQGHERVHPDAEGGRYDGY